MLAELKMELKTDNKQFGYFQSSNLQGVIMEKVSPVYAGFLHEQGLNPYSQHIEKNDEKIIWVIHTLDKDAYEQIIHPLLDESFQTFCIHKKGIRVDILSKEVRTIPKNQLISKFYQEEAEKFFDIEFITPTSFKSQGNYSIMPDLRLIYQSLMNKSASCCSDMNLYDEELLEELIRNSYISGYRLKSTFFPLEGIKIPSFKGCINIRVKGADTIAKYIRFLTEFGEYSGIGIKTAMGMGAIKIIKKDRRK